MGASAAVAKPLTLVSGYLGTGKTTLINHVLASGALGRAAVVVNDFGSVNIDAALIRSTGTDTIELTNGCICCQITDDVQRTMTALAARDDLDHVVCEVSGIGNPAQLGGWRTYPGFRPGGVVVCVDAGVTLKRLRDEFVSDIVRAQIRATDLLVVTKADSAGDDLVSRTVARCREIVGPVPLEIVRGDEWGPVLGALEGIAPESAGGPAGRGAGGGTPAQMETTAHADAHASQVVELSEPVDIDQLTGVLRAHAQDLVRAKGVVRTADGARVVVELAGGVVTSQPGSEGGVGGVGGVGREEHVETAEPAPVAAGTHFDSTGRGSTTPGSTLVLIAVGPRAHQSLFRASHDLERDVHRPGGAALQPDRGV